MSVQYKVLEVKFIGTKGAAYHTPCFGELWTWKNLYLFGCPRCGVVMRLDHLITIGNDKVTISPSVGCSQCNAHFFVKDSKIEVLQDM